MHRDEVQLADVLLQRFSSEVAPESGIGHFALPSAWIEDFQSDFVAKLLLDESLGCSIDVESEGSSGFAVNRLQALMVAEPDFSSTAAVFSAGLVGREETAANVDDVVGGAVAEDDVESLDGIHAQVERVAVEISVDIVRVKVVDYIFSLEFI